MEHYFSVLLSYRRYGAMWQHRWQLPPNLPFILRFAVSESPLHGMGQSDQQLRCAVQYRTIHFFYFWRHAYESARTPPLLRKLQHQRRAAILGAGREVALCGSHRLTAESIQTDPRPDKEPERSVTHAERIKNHSGLSSGSPAAG